MGLTHRENGWDSNYVIIIDTPSHQTHCKNRLLVVITSIRYSLSACAYSIVHEIAKANTGHEYVTGSVTRPSAFDQLRYVKAKGKRPRESYHMICSTAGITDSKCNCLFTFSSTATERLENRDKFRGPGDVPTIAIVYWLTDDLGKLPLRLLYTNSL